jgi:methyl-accepting chemotaxis protein
VEGKLSNREMLEGQMSGAGTAMSQMDFGLIKMAHRTWRMRLRRYLDGKEDIDPKTLASHQSCELGKWIYSSGMTKFGHIADMKELEKKHKFMHGLVKQVVTLKLSGKTKEAEQEFSKVHESAEAVISLLTTLEKRVLGS